MWTGAMARIIGPWNLLHMRSQLLKPAMTSNVGMLQTSEIKVDISKDFGSE
jgi:hypothetical protein